MQMRLGPMEHWPKVCWAMIFSLKQHTALVVLLFITFFNRVASGHSPQQCLMCADSLVCSSGLCLASVQAVCRLAVVDCLPQQSCVVGQLTLEAVPRRHFILSGCVEFLADSGSGACQVSRDALRLDEYGDMSSYSRICACNTTNCNKPSNFASAGGAEFLRLLEFDETKVKGDDCVSSATDSESFRSIFLIALPIIFGFILCK